MTRNIPKTVKKMPVKFMIPHGLKNGDVHVHASLVCVHGSFIVFPSVFKFMSYGTQLGKLCA